MQDRLILVVDDDRAVRSSLTRALRLEGFEIQSVGTGEEALAVLTRGGVSLVVLDIAMPGIDGLEVCRCMRERGDTTPVLMLTARVTTPDRVAGLDAGADDYLTKPFELAELNARVRALMRRTAPAAPPVLDLGDLRIDVAARRVFHRGGEVFLSRTEFELLRLLVENAGTVLEPSEIYLAIWEYDFGPRSKNLAVYVSYLRKKLGLGPDELIRNVRGVGYTVNLP